MVDYKVFYAVWTSAVLAQCCLFNNNVDPSSDGSKDESNEATTALSLPPTNLLVTLLGITLTAGLFYNWLWRFVVFLAVWFGGVLHGLPSTYTAAFVLWAMIHTSPVLSCPALGWRKPMKVEGAVFVTGCDSGMGFWTAGHLAKLGYKVFAGCYTIKDSEVKLRQHVGNDDVFDKRITCVPLDVTDSANVADAAKVVESALQASNDKLIGVVNCAGLGYNGPTEYFPMDLYKRQMEVNFFGYVRVVQAFMPLVRKGSSEQRRGRIVLIGTGGGILSPAPPLLSAYMSSKWAVEAFAHCTRLELQLTNKPIDVTVLNPGFIKPTQLMEVGMKLTRDMWTKCKELWKHNYAEEEYGDLLNTFIEYSANEKGTHVSKVAHVVEQILASHRPNPCYKVGDDSKAAPVVGLMPIAIREFIVKYSMYKQVGTT